MPPLEPDFPGLWGHPTSTIDWCESNYAVSYYVAEFWNTISNIVMIVPPLISALLAYKDNLEFRYIMCHLGLSAVGIGSWCFHGTLLYNMQLLDELPMIYGTAIMVYSLMEVDGKPHSQNQFLQGVLLVYCALVTAMYLMNKEPVFHEIAYGVMVIADVILSFRIVRTFQYPNSKKICIGATIAYSSGFFLWNMDHMFCNQFKEIRSYVPSPLQPLLQGHAWWHVLAGIGTYTALIFCAHARLYYLKKPFKIKKFAGVLPVIRTIPKGPKNGASNGIL